MMLQKRRLHINSCF